jgi:prepilin-type N-terminal cleavage/methylation domain-containing protein
MQRTLRKVQQGFTIIELLIVIAIIAILAGLVLNNFQSAQAKARDTQRITKINALHTKLEEFYNEASGYPSSANADPNFPGMDAKANTDPRGGSLTNTIVADNAAMLAAAAPTSGSGNEFKYVTYPTGCTLALSGGVYSGTACTGYRLMSYIEKPTTTTTNPYVKLGLQNP